jgi:predicted PurR-regulated permease PerM
MFYGNLGLYGEQLNSLANDIANFLNFDRFDLTAIDVFLHDLAALSSEFLPGTFPLLLNFTTNAVISVVNILLGLILSVYILADKERIKRQFSKIMTAYLPPKILGKTRYVLDISNKIFSSFVLG